MTNDIGIVGIEAPKRTCTDKNCPFHGNLKVRGRIFEGKVIKAKMDKSVVVQWDRLFFLKKFERYEKRRSRVTAHNPPCINAKEGDIVKIMGCRPLSKTKKFVVISKKQSKEGESKK